MAQRSRFYDSVSGDRVYDSSAFAQVLAANIGDGVVYGSGGGLELGIVENSPPAMSVRVSNGVGFVQGYYHEVYSGPDVLAIAAANATNPRIDRVVLRRDLAGRVGSIAVLTGTPAASPAPPALTQIASGIFELPLAQVRVNAAVASIVQANITDERGARAKGPDLGSLTDPTSGHRHGGTAGDGRKVQHADLSSVGANDHHPTVHAHDGVDGSGTVGYAAVTGKPTTFVPSVHGHTSGSVEGQVAYGVLTGVPSTFQVAAHDHSGTGVGVGGKIAYGSLTGAPTSMDPTAHALDPASGDHTGTLPWGSVSGKPTTFAAADHALDPAGGIHTGTLPWGSVSGKPTTFAPTSHGAAHLPGGSDTIANTVLLKSAGGGGAGNVIWDGTTDPGASAVEGDIWIKG